MSISGLSQETNTTLSRSLPDKKGISTTLHQQVKITTTASPSISASSPIARHILQHLILASPERGRERFQEEELLVSFRKTTERLKQLREVTRQIIGHIHEENSLQPILQGIIESINKLLDEDVISTVYLYEEEQIDKWQIYKSDRANVSSSSSIDKFARDQCAQYAFFIETKQPLSSKLIHMRVFPRKEYRGLTAVLPLIFGNKVIGVLFIEMQKVHPTFSELSGLLELFADQAAVAIETARSLENLKKLNQQIADQQELVTRAMIANDFVHHINNVAGSIPIRVAMIRESLDAKAPDYERVYDCLDCIAIDARNLLSAANGLKRKPKREDINIAVMLRRMRNNVKIQYPNIVVEYQKPSTLQFVQAIDDQLSYAIWNVIVNAVEAMPNGGKLTLHASDYSLGKKQWVKIEIKDTGQGLATDAKNIFSLSYTTKGLGHGYGLWRTKNVIDNLGGSIVIESKPLTGTLFTILLPIAKIKR